MITPNQFKAGLAIDLDGGLYTIVEYQHVKPGKGGAFVRTKLKNMRTKKIIDKTFRPDEKFQDAFIEDKKIQYLYQAGSLYYFMDLETFEEIVIEKEKLEDVVGFLKDNMEVLMISYKEQIIEIRFPSFIELKIAHTEPGIKGDTAKGSFKPATLETGAIIQVPLFVNENDSIKIDTRTGEYVERVLSSTRP
ncbi:MAG: elongation factor P [Candidatus Omnitrophota bacterium]|nr:MAG: elongation factor P [Candidatus Omnitrophota bacterium]